MHCPLFAIHTKRVTILPRSQIHQDLPYGTMEDNEMRRMDIGCLQDDGVIFLWVTGKRQSALSGRR
jgi:N6-adenosine-specific RNA methylase IME4